MWPRQPRAIESTSLTRAKVMLILAMPLFPFQTYNDPIKRLQKELRQGTDVLQVKSPSHFRAQSVELYRERGGVV